MTTETNLSEKIRAIANGDEELLTKAQEFDDAVASGKPKSILGTWARARKAYCEQTGESLI